MMNYKLMNDVSNFFNVIKNGNACEIVEYINNCKASPENIKCDGLERLYDAVDYISQTEFCNVDTEVIIDL